MESAYCRVGGATSWKGVITVCELPVSKLKYQG